LKDVDPGLAGVLLGGVQFSAGDDETAAEEATRDGEPHIKQGKEFATGWVS
jgi:hypothetical protein